MEIVRVGGGGGARAAKRFRVKSESNDYLVCRTWDGTTEGSTDVLVAKPYLLQRTPFHGVAVTYPNAQVITYTYAAAYERTADDTVDSETQIVTPRYFVDEEIIGIAVPRGGTGVDDCDWMDLNTAGRHWAKES